MLQCVAYNAIAKDLGIEVSPALHARSDEVIE